MTAAQFQQWALNWIVALSIVIPTLTAAGVLVWQQFKRQLAAHATAIASTAGKTAEQDVTLAEHGAALNGQLDARIDARAEARAQLLVDAAIAKLPPAVQFVVHQVEGLTNAAGAVAVPVALPRGGMAGSLPTGGSPGPASPGGQGG